MSEGSGFGCNLGESENIGDDTSDPPERLLSEGDDAEDDVASENNSGESNNIGDDSSSAISYPKFSVSPKFSISESVDVGDDVVREAYDTDDGVSGGDDAGDGVTSEAEDDLGEVSGVEDEAI